MSVGLDAGCADMRNRRFFETRTYIGLDSNADLLAKGKSKNPDAEAMNCTILNAPEIVVDFVHCIQVFVNADFNKKEALDVTRKLVSMVRPGGVLLLNTGKQTIHHDPEIKALLQSSFHEVVETKYGNIGPNQVPIVFSLFIAAIMYFLPMTRVMRGHTKTYYKCVGRTSSLL